MRVKPLELSDGRQLARDEKGYLLDRSAWDRSVALAMATEDGLELNDDHFVVIGIFQDYYEEFEIEPPMRALVKLSVVALGQEKGSSRYLYRLFPAGPTTQACRYAGLPRPLSCI